MKLSRIVTALAVGWNIMSDCPFSRTIRLVRASLTVFAFSAVAVTFMMVVVQHHAYAYNAPTIPTLTQQDLESYDSGPTSPCNQSPYYFQAVESWATPASGQSIVVQSGSKAPTVALNFYNLEFGCHYATANYSPAQALTAANYPDDSPMGVSSPTQSLPNAPVQGDYLAANTSNYIDSATVTGNTGSPTQPGNVAGLAYSETNIPFQAGTRYWYPSGSVPGFLYTPDPAAPAITQTETVTITVTETPVSTFTYGGNTYYRCVDGDEVATTGDAATAEYRTIYGVLVPCPTNPVSNSFVIYVSGSPTTCPTGDSGTYPNCQGPNTTGSATCSTPSFDPARLPWDPGENVSLTVSVNYTAPTGTTGGPVGSATYTTYQQGAAPPPTLAITSPNWGWAPQNAPPETSLTATTTVPDTPGTFNVDWTFNWSVLETTYTWIPPSYTEQPNGSGGDTEVLVPGTDQYDVSSTTVAEPQLQCAHPASISGNPPSQAVEDYPYFRVYGGDISAGGTCSTTPNATTGSIYGWPTESNAVSPGTWIGGAGTQFAEAAMGVIYGAASATNNGTGTNNPAPTGLSFSNQSTDAVNDDYGGDSCGVDTPTSATIAGYYQSPPSSAGSFISGASLSGDDGVLYGGASTGDTIAASTIAAGQHTVLYVNGDVVISGNITFGSSSGSPADSWTSTSQIPSLWIIATGNISIAPNVTEIDGIYVAAGSGGTGGNIDTCNNSGGQTDSGYYAACYSKLTVDGSLVAANNVYLTRTFGTVSDSSATDTGGNAAELFDFNPLLFLPTQTSLSSGYQAISSLPPVL
jgi:hypothetical protein